MNRKVLSAFAALLAFATLSAQAVGIGNFLPKHIFGYQFTDVQTDAWYIENIRTCYEYGLMRGTSETLFSPDGKISIAQAITLASRIHNTYYDSMTDLEPAGTDWYTGAVNYAEKAGILKIGEFLGEYEREATRAELVYLLSGALPSDEYAPLASPALPEDVPEDSIYASSILKLYAAGVLTGNEKGLFMPDEPVTRAEASAIVSRVVQPSSRIAPQKEPAKPPVPPQEPETPSVPADEPKPEQQ